jgi:hypothetical protein
LTTRATLRQSIRDELNDNGSTKLWSDGLLNSYIAEAIRAYSREAPEEASGTLDVTANVETVALPARFIRAVRVEQPAGALRYPLSTMRTYEGTFTGLSQLIDFESRVGEAGGRPGYRIWGGNVVLDPAPTSDDDDGTIDYYRSYAEPSADGDTLATPSVDDDLLIRLVCARALDWISTDEAKRMRFERQRGVSAISMADHYRSLVDDEFARRRSVVSGRTLEITE